MSSWLGPLVIVVACLLGECALRCVDRLEARLIRPPRRRSRPAGNRHPRGASPSELIAHGIAARANR